MDKAFVAILMGSDSDLPVMQNVVDVLDKLAGKLSGPLVIHSCGPHGMLKAVADWGLRHGARAHLAMESVMACGTGVCRGCPMFPSSAACSSSRTAWSAGPS